MGDKSVEFHKRSPIQEEIKPLTSGEFSVSVLLFDSFWTSA